MKFNLLKNNKNTANLNSVINERTREKSRGRSMVEMLGVLAIIGVLSIGGIQGYTMAMRKYKANEIVEVMQKYATILYSGCRNELLNKEQETSDHLTYEDTKTLLNCNTWIPFSDSGLGALPSGVIESPWALFELYDEHGATIGADANPSIIRTNSGDIVRFYIELESKELCQTIIDMVGTKTVNESSEGVGGYYKSGKLGLCEGFDGVWEGNYALVSFIMN